jgi:hypothetical protein
MINELRKVKTSVLITNGIYALSITLCCLIWMFNPFDFSIPKGSVPLISEATKYNVSIASRINFFYKLVFFGTLLWVFFTLLFHFFYTSYVKSFRQYSHGLYYSIPIIPFSYFLLTGVEVEKILFLNISIFLLFLIKIFISKSKTISKSNLLIFPSFEQSLGFSFLFYISINFLFGNFEFIQKNTVSIFLIVFITVLGLFYIFRKKINNKHLKIILMTLAGIPFFLFISVEFHVLSLEKHWFVIGYKKLFISMELFWFLICFLFVGIKSYLLTKTTLRIYVASLIFGVTLILFYKPTFPVVNELFELANPANSLLRVFQFGEIPILDFMSSHGISEQWYGYLYQAIHGISEQIDFTVFSFLNEYLYFLVVYLILVRVGFRATGSMIFIFFFPVLEEVFFSNICFVYLVLFAIQRFINYQSTRNALQLFFLLFFLIVWRIDTGVAAIFSTLIFLPLSIWLSNIRFSLFAIIRSLVIFIIFLFTILIFAVILRSWDYVLNNFLSSLHYVVGAQAHGYSKMFDGSYHQFYVFHFLFTTLSILLTCAAIFIIKIKKLKFNERKNQPLVFSIFSFILFITNAQRGIVRHGFAEQSEIFFISTFYLGVAFFLIHFVRNNSLSIKYALFFSVLFFSFIVTKYFPFLPQKLNSTNLLNQDTFTNLSADLSKENYQGRVIENSKFKERVYGELKSYINQNLSPNETFLDFSNSPMLYYYCERNVPGYFNQIMQNTVDEYLQNQLIQSLKKHSTPLVIYSSYPSSWFDATDGILNTVRYYKISEYIFENYKPLGILNNHSVFGKKGRIWKGIKEKDSIIGKSIDIDLGYIAGWEGNKYHTQNPALKKYKLLKEMNLKFNNTVNAQKMQIDAKWRAKNHVSLLLKVCPKLKMKTITQQGIVIFRNSAGEEVHRVSFVRDDNQFSNYAIRLSNHYFWHQKSALTVELVNFIGLERVLLIKEK